VSPAGDGGAVELAVRFARVEIDNAFDNGLAAAAGNSEEVQSLTFGVNWWIRSNIRITLNAVREVYEDELQFDTRAEDTLFGLIARAQIDF
jgi:phosphate-selective porin